MSESFVEAEGVRLFVESAGDGPPLVLLHGFTGSGRTLAELASRLRTDFRTIRIDLVGHGRSDAPAEVAAYSMEACTRQVARVIEQLAGEPAHVLGYSMGGRVALALAAWQPGWVRSAVLVGARAGLAEDAERVARIRADEALAAAIEDEGIEKFVDRWMALPLFASQARLGPTFLAEARAERLRQRTSGLAHSLRGMGSGAQPPLFDHLPRIETPTLVIVGAEDDRFAPVARDLAATLPGATLAIIPEAGHAAHLEQPAAFAERTIEFLSRVEHVRSHAKHPEHPCRT